MTTPQFEARYIIEREGRALGMVIGEPQGYVVYACAQHMWPLDRQVFRSLSSAQRQIALLDRDMGRQAQNPFARGQRQSGLTARPQKREDR